MSVVALWQAAVLPRMHSFPGMHGWHDGMYQYNTGTRVLEYRYGIRAGWRQDGMDAMANNGTPQNHKNNRKLDFQTMEQRCCCFLPRLPRLPFIIVIFFSANSGADSTTTSRHQVGAIFIIQKSKFSLTSEFFPTMRFQIAFLVGLGATAVTAQTPGVPHGGGECASDMDCSLGGTCETDMGSTSTSSKKCVCDPWFTGPSCALLNLQAPDSDQHGTCGKDFDSYYSWGGRALPDDAGKWHLYASFICNHDTLAK